MRQKLSFLAYKWQNKLDQKPDGRLGDAKVKANISQT